MKFRRLPGNVVKGLGTAGLSNYNYVITSKVEKTFSWNRAKKIPLKKETRTVPSLRRLHKAAPGSERLYKSYVDGFNEWQTLLVLAHFTIK